MWKQLLATGLILGFVTPIGAANSKSLVSASTVDPSAIYQQDKCKDGEVWDEAQKKCVKN